MIVEPADDGIGVVAYFAHTCGHSDQGLYFTGQHIAEECRETQEAMVCVKCAATFQRMKLNEQRTEFEQAYRAAADLNKVYIQFDLNVHGEYKEMAVRLAFYAFCVCWDRLDATAPKLAIK